MPLNKKKEPIPVDFDSMLREIHRKIGEIVHSRLDSMAEISSKEPIQLLYVSASFVLTALGNWDQSDRTGARTVWAWRIKPVETSAKGKAAAQQVQRVKKESSKWKQGEERKREAEASFRPNAKGACQNWQDGQSALDQSKD